jgi:hypothetical protein
VNLAHPQNEVFLSEIIRFSQTSVCDKSPEMVDSAQVNVICEFLMGRQK